MHTDDTPPTEVEMPHNMTAEADDAQHIPGAEEIPADIPNAPPGDMPLEYNLQNFNALVSANTALIGEVANQAQIIADLRDRIEDMREESKRNDKTFGQFVTREAEWKKEKTILQNDLSFARSQAEQYRRQLDRTQGYLDRVLDEEDRIDAPATETRTVPVERPTVGPDLNNIPQPIHPAHRNQEGDRLPMYAVGASIETGHGRRRRY